MKQILLVSDLHLPSNNIRRKKAGLPTPDAVYKAFEDSLYGKFLDYVICLGDISNHGDQQQNRSGINLIYKNFFRSLTLKAENIWMIRGNTDPEYVLDTMKDFGIENVDDTIKKIEPGLKIGFIGGADDTYLGDHPYTRKDEDVYNIFKDMVKQGINTLMMHSSPYSSPFHKFSVGCKNFENGQFSKMSEELQKENHSIISVFHGHTHNWAGEQATKKLNNGEMISYVVPSCLYNGYNGFLGKYTILTINDNGKIEYNIVDLNNFL